MVEPGFARDRCRSSLDRELARHGEMREAVVVGRGERIGTLAAVPRGALQQHRLRDLELELQRKVGSGDRGLQAPVLLAQGPVIDPDVHPTFARVSEVEAFARTALRVAEPADPRVGHRRVREQHLARRKPARVVLAHARAHAKERHLEAVRAALTIGEPARDVPPFDAMRRVTSRVARQLDGVAGNDGRVVGIRGKRRACEDERHGQQRDERREDQCGSAQNGRDKTTAHISTRRRAPRITSPRGRRARRPLPLQDGR